MAGETETGQHFPGVVQMKGSATRLKAVIRRDCHSTIVAEDSVADRLRTSSVVIAD